MNRSLFSLAIIRTNWEKQKKDHIDNFVPLVGTLISEKKYKSIGGQDLANISSDFKIKFGLFLPSAPLTVILRRMAKDGYLSKSDGAWIPSFEKIQELDISKNSKEIERKYESFIKSLLEYIETETNEKVEPAIIEEGLLGYLKKHDLDILFAANTGSLLPSIRENKKIEFLIGKFIEISEKSNPIAFDNLVDISIGHALASTILYEDFQIFDGKLKDLKIYFDTPWVFDLIGIRGKGKQDIAIELLEMAKLDKAKRHVLDINIGELQTNFEICLADFENKRDPEKASRTYKHCIMNDITESDIHTFIAGLNEILSTKYELQPDTVPDHNESKKYQIDENALYDFIDNTYKELNIIRDIEEIDKKEKEHLQIVSEKALGVNTKQETKKVPPSKIKADDVERENNTIWRDVYSLSGVYRMREGVIPRTLRESKAIFVTTNSSLALASRNFEIKENRTRSSMPSCITDCFLGTLIWLNSPSKATEIVKKKIIADCYALTQPSSELIKAYLFEVDKLRKNNKISSDEHLLLRTHQGAYKILNSKTYGDAREFTSATPYEILEQILKDMEESAALKVKKQLDVSSAEIIKERQAREKLEFEHKNTKNELSDEKIKSQKRENALAGKAEMASKFVIYLAVFGLTLFLIWLSYRIQNKAGFGIPWLDISISILLIVIGIVNIVFGFSVIRFVPKLILKLKLSIFNQLIKEE